MVLIWVVILLKQNGKIEYITNPFEFSMFAFYIYAILTWIISMFLLRHNYHVPQLLNVSIAEYGKNYLFMSMFNEGFKKLIFTITNVILVYMFATNYVNKNNFDRIYYTFFIVGAIASVYGILQYFGVELIWPKTLNPFGGRCVSTFGNPNFLSSFLILLFPLMLTNYLIGKDTALMFIFMIMYFCALLCTLTRSSWIGLVVSLVFLCIFILFNFKEFVRRNRTKIILLAAILIVLFLVWPQSSVGGNPAPVGRLFEVQRAKDVYSPLHQRFLIWFCGWDMIKEKIFTGKGWGLFELFYPFYQGKYLFIEKLSFRTHANNAHNEIIEVWSQTGTIGLGIYILFFIVFFIYSYKLIQSKKELYDKLMILALACSVIGMLVDNLLNVTIHFCVPAFLYFFNIGAIATFDENRNKKNICLPPVINTLVILVGILIILRLILNFLGEINYFKGFKYSKRNELTQALYYLSKANKFQKYEVNNNYELANTYARMKKLNEAVHYYYEALASNCGYDEIHFNIATVYSQLGKVEEAKLHYTQSLFINPLSKDAYMALGSLLFADLDKNPDSAIKLYEQATTVFPDNKDFYNNLGYLYVKSGQEQKALKCYEKALQIDPNFEFAKRNYLVLANKLGIKNNIVSTYETLISQVVKDIEQRKYDEAEIKCRKILEIFPNDVIAKFYLANIYFSKNLLQEAVSIYEEILKLQPENYNVRYNLAMAYIKQQKYGEAEEQLEFILSKQPNNQVIRKQLMDIRTFRSFH
ncbi:MAG: tetratricopeptide repeat protein [Endomicrobia bacterium]|nr:tetratricopeptide repeat protein [Endomicrobiia bacterium]MDW8055133.1 tetratricopeptide repeat protein [Elusimicrobiota bacterium]